MTSLATKIKLYAEANSKVADFSPTGNVEVSDDGSGAKITKWSIDGLSQPTTSQLNGVASDAEKVLTNIKVIKTRKRSYGDLSDQLDEIYHDIDAWKTRIKSIKDSNPKS